MAGPYICYNIEESLEVLTKDSGTSSLRHIIFLILAINLRPSGIYTNMDL